MDSKEKKWILEQIKDYFLKDDKSETGAIIKEYIDELQKESFLEGYCYAIDVLQEGIVKDKEKE